MNLFKKFFFVIVLCMFFSYVNVFASSNVYIENENNKILEITEEYTNKLNIDIDNIAIEKVDDNNLKIIGKIKILDNINSNLKAIYNIKKSKNEEYNLNDISIIGFPSIKKNLKAYWYRKIDNENIGKGYIKENDNVIFDREYGTGDDYTTQNEEIYTNNKLFNCITGSDLLKSIIINNENNDITFEIIIEEEKISKIRYLYIGMNNNIVRQNNNITYTSLLSDYIDILSYYNQNNDESKTELNTKNNSGSGGSSGSKGDGLLKLQPITNEIEETPLFGAIPLTGSATEVKVSEHTSNSSSESGEETLTITYSENPNYIASYNINNITMTQDNNNYYFNYDIDYKNASLNYDETKSVGTYTETGRTSGTDDIYQITNGGNLILSTTNINKLVYLYNYSYSKWYDNKNNGNLSKSGAKKEITIQENGITNTYKYNLDYGNTTTTPTKEYNYASQLNITNLSKTGAYPVADDTSREYNYNIPATTTKKLILSNNDCVFSNTQVTRDDSVDYFKYNYTGNITIPKTKISEMKYLKLNAPRAVLVSHTETFQEFILDTQTGKSNYNKRYATVVGTSIDLSPYTNCTHTWKTKQILNKTQHIIYCSKCLLEKTENHTYQYEYDGLTNNLCICGLNKYVNHHFTYNSSQTTDKIVKLTASSSCIAYTNPTKTGYIFKNYEKYYKYFENMTNPVFSTTATKLTDTLKGTITTLPTMTDIYSQVFIAKYDPIKYNVVFKSNSNLGFNVSLTGISNLSNAKYDTEYNNPSVSQTGYTFKGWSLTSGSSTVNIKSTDKIKNLTTENNKSIDLYPVFDKNKYIFKFATQSNINKIIITQNIANLSCEYGTKYNLPNNIEITGYIFKGWTLTKGSATINFSPKAEINNYTSINNKEYLLYPVYEPIKYSVVFKANSNLDFNISLTSISNLNNISYDTEHNVPTASHIGYTFKGWSLTSGSSTVNIKTTDKIKNLTTVNGKTINLYPVFDKNKYIFKFATQSNINKIIITQNIANLSCEYGTKYNLPDNIEVIGYIFNGWTKTKGSSNIDFSPKSEIFNYTAINNQSIILYPVYEAIKYNVIFNKESNLGFDINLTSINNLKDIEYDKSYDVPIVSYAGYTFIGWSLTSGSSIVNIKITDKIENLTIVNGKTVNLYPVFEVNKYIIKYATKSNIDKIIITEEIEDLNCEYDKKYNLSNNVKVTGYNFKGWTLTKESNNIDFEPNKEIYNYTPIDNNVITIYPVYEPIKYIIIYSNDNVKELNINGNIESQYIYYDEPQKLKKNINVMGYKFVGWSLKATSSEINFKPEQELLNYTTVDNKEITVYPVYKTYSYTFKFSSDNNMNKYIVASISDLVCEVDKKYNLPDNIDIEGYNFKGWTLTKGSSDINFVPNEEIYNYNIELLYDNMEINLYPIYEPIKYSFKFATQSNITDIQLNSSSEEFIYDEEKQILSGKEIKGYNFLGYSLKASSSVIDIEPKQKINNYTNIDNKEFVLYPVYDYKTLKVEYITSIGYFDNNKQIATISYTTQTLTDFKYPKINSEATFDRKGNMTSSKYLEFTGYVDEKTNKAFTTFEDFKKYVIDRNIENDFITIVYNGRSQTRRFGNNNSGGGGSGYSGGPLHENRTIEPVNQIVEIPVKEIIVKKENKIVKTIKKEQKISKKDLIDLLSEVYDDFKDQNNINDKIIVQVNKDDKSSKHDIIDFINNVYSDFNNDNIIVRVGNNYGENYDIVNYINDIYIDFYENNVEDNIIVGFTSSEIIKNNNEKQYIKEIKETIKKDDDDVDIATKSIIKTNDYINKLFDDEEDIENINNIIEILQERDYIQLYKNIDEGKYNNTIKYFIEKYDPTFVVIEKELKNKKYTDLDNKLIDILNSGEYQDLRDDINKVILNNEKDYADFKMDMKEHNLRQLINDCFKGRYKALFNELMPVLLNKKYNKFFKAIEYELIDGEYADISYDFIYYIFDTIYNYKEPKIVEETQIVETTTVEETNKEVIEIENEKKIEIVPIISLVAIIVAFIIIVVLIIKKITGKKGEGYE